MFYSVAATVDETSEVHFVSVSELSQSNYIWMLMVRENFPGKGEVSHTYRRVHVHANTRTATTRNCLHPTDA
jgi:hypothetical protein